MKAQSAKHRATTQKTVYLQLNPAQRTPKDSTFKSQKQQNKSMRDPASNISCDNAAQLAFSMIEIKTDESPTKACQSEVTKSDIEGEDKKFEIELLCQKIQFLEQQLSETEQKLKSQEKLYEGIISAYKQTQTSTESQSLSQLVEKHTKVELTNSETASLQSLVQELRDKVKSQQEKIENLESKVQDSEYRLTNEASEFRFKNKELKLQISDLQLKLKHSENKYVQREDYYQRLLEDQNTKYQSELELAKKTNELDHETALQKSQVMVDSIKETYESQVRDLQNKLTEMRSHLKTQEIQISEYQSQISDKFSSNMEVLETIHLRYLDEIKNLNMTLSHFRLEKEQEIQKLQEQLKLTDLQLKKSENSNKELREKLENDKSQYEQRIAEIRKKLDLTYKQLLEHEKCEITIQAQKKRMSEMKHKIEQLETREKWQWKYLLDKRGQIEQEKVELRRKMNNQSKINRSKACSQTRQNDELGKKVNLLNSELEQTITQKLVLKSRFDELSKEIKVLKKDKNSLNGSITDRSMMARSVSPRTAHAYKFTKGTDFKNQTLNSTANNFGKLLKQIGDSRQRILGSPLYQDNKKLLGFSLLQASQTQSFVPSPQHPRGDKQKESQQKSAAQDLPPTSQKFSLTDKLQKHENVLDDDINSFLGSPRMDENQISVCQDISASRVIGVMDSTALSCISRSKAVSQYEIKCRNCLKIYSTVENFMNHQLNCNSQPSGKIEEDDEGQHSDIVHVETSESPEMRRTQSDIKLLKRKDSKTQVNPQLKKQSSMHKILYKSEVASSPRHSTSREKNSRKRSRNSNKGYDSSQYTSSKALQNNRYNSKVEHPQILNTTLKNSTLKLHIPSIKESSICIAEQFTAPTSTKNCPNQSSIFHQSLLATSNPCEISQSQSSELEKENNRLIMELKQAKMELAVHQEATASSEMTLKKELLNLQYQMNLLQRQQHSSRASFIAPPPKGSYTTSNKKQNSIKSSNFSASQRFNHNTSVTQFNIPCQEDCDQEEFSKQPIVKIYPTPSPTPDITQQPNQFSLKIHKSSDQLDSPLLCDAKEDEDTTRQELNHYVQTKKSPNFMLSK